MGDDWSYYHHHHHHHHHHHRYSFLPPFIGCGWATKPNPNWLSLSAEREQEGGAKADKSD